MKQLTLQIDDATFESAESKARSAGQSLTGLVLEWLKGFTASSGSEFDRLLREEETLREQLRKSGRQFAASERLSRDEIHDRHALR
ncbi:MAG TPA: hypothetical protein VGE39_27010 [Prosthecobacter sp.]